MRSGKTGKRVGLLGGSFNPAHGGHRRISLFVMRALGLDEIWWMVSPGNPLKPKKGMASLMVRVKSARRMARLTPIRVTAIEQQLAARQPPVIFSSSENHQYEAGQKISQKPAHTAHIAYTADTLEALQHFYPRHRFVWLMGSDNLAQFHLWHRWRDIARNMPIAVIARPGYDRAAYTSPAMAWLSRNRVRPNRLLAHCFSPNHMFQGSFSAGQNARESEDPQYFKGSSQQRRRKRRSGSAAGLTILRFDPDPRSASAIRKEKPDWPVRYSAQPLRDSLTRIMIGP